MVENTTGTETPPGEKQEVIPTRKEQPPISLPPRAEPAEGRREPRPVTLEKAGFFEGRNRNLIIVAGAAVVIILAIFFTFNVTFTDSTGSTVYPYTTTYEVVFPTSERVQIGNVEILAIPFQDKVSLTVNKEPEEILLGETREISARKATISTLGIPMMGFDFRVFAEYRGMVGKDAKFYLSIKTSDQVPTFFIDRILPSSIKARPA
jgi:hypothetical protein